MRILWFANSPSMAIQKLSNGFNVGGSWIESLEKGILSNPDIELGVAFTWTGLEKMDRFKVEGHPTQYFAMPYYPKNKWARVWRNHLALTEPEEAKKDYFQVVEEFKPDIIHFFGTESDYPLIIPKIKVPTVIWFQGNLTIYEKIRHMVFPHKKTLRHEGIKAILKGATEVHFAWFYRSIVRREKKIFSYAQNFTGRTAWDRRVVSVMAPQAKYYHLEETMRLPFHKKEWKVHHNRDKFILLTTIRTNVHKGLEVLMEAAKLLEPLINKKLEWRVVGIGDESPYVKVSRQLSNYTSSDNSVKLLGFRSGEELSEELLDADAYVHPSHIENSPNAVCEAMLMGVPVVSTNVGGVSSLLVENKEGLLVQNGDSYALAGAILEIYNNPDKASEIGANARKRGLKRNNTEKICANLLGIYRQILQENNNVQPENTKKLNPV